MNGADLHGGKTQLVGEPHAYPLAAGLQAHDLANRLMGKDAYVAE